MLITVFALSLMLSFCAVGLVVLHDSLIDWSHVPALTPPHRGAVHETSSTQV